MYLFKKKNRKYFFAFRCEMVIDEMIKNAMPIGELNQNKYKVTFNVLATIINGSKTQNPTKITKSIGNSSCGLYRDLNYEWREKKIATANQYSIARWILDI